MKEVLKMSKNEREIERIKPQSLEDEEEMTAEQLAHRLFQYVRKRKIQQGLDTSRGEAKIFLRVPSGTFYDVLERMEALYPPPKIRREPTSKPRDWKLVYFMTDEDIEREKERMKEEGE